MEFLYSLEVICAACFTDYYLILICISVLIVSVYKHYKLEIDLLYFPKLDFLMDLRVWKRVIMT